MCIFTDVTSHRRSDRFPLRHHPMLRTSPITCTSTWTLAAAGVRLARVVTWRRATGLANKPLPFVCSYGGLWVVRTFVRVYMTGRARERRMWTRGVQIQANRWGYEQATVGTNPTEWRCVRTPPSARTPYGRGKPIEVKIDAENLFCSILGSTVPFVVILVKYMVVFVDFLSLCPIGI